MSRRPFTTQEAFERGMTRSALKWGVRKGRIQRIGRGVYVPGSEPVTPVERALGAVVATKGVASGTLAGLLHGLDSGKLRAPFVTVPGDRDSEWVEVRRSNIAPSDLTIIDGYTCTNSVRTLVDLASTLDDLQWEQALESALRKRLLRLGELEASVDGGRQTAGVRRIRRVLGLRLPDAPPTESLLETLMVQLIRADRRLPEPTRQLEVFDRWNLFVARVDLAWPEAGVFVELDGQHHKDQPVYDARRETAIVAAKGWLPARFTWQEVTRHPNQTVRRLVDILEKATSLARSA